VASSDTIKQFLVKLGFSVEENQLTKFRTAIEGATKAVFALAVAVETTAWQLRWEWPGSQPTLMRCISHHNAQIPRSLT
jgi:hypothetical protein